PMSWSIVCSDRRASETPGQHPCAADAGRTRRKQMQLRSALLAATVLATPFAASAQPVTGLYVGAGVGVNFTQKESVNGAAIGVPALVNGFLSTDGNIKGSAGFAGVLSVGWGFGNGLRAEIEGNYRNNSSGGFENGNNNNFSAVGGGTKEQK